MARFLWAPVQQSKSSSRKARNISYKKDGETVSALDAAKHFPDVKRWLLVGRYNEGPRLLTKDDRLSETPKTFPKSQGMVIATCIRKHPSEAFSGIRLTTIQAYRLSHSYVCLLHLNGNNLAW